LGQFTKRTLSASYAQHNAERREERTDPTKPGPNVLIGKNPQKIVKVAREIMEPGGIKIKLERLNNPFGDGQASQKIVACTWKRR